MSTEYDTQSHTTAPLMQTTIVEVLHLLWKLLQRHVLISNYSSLWFYSSKCTKWSMCPSTQVLHLTLVQLYKQGFGSRSYCFLWCLRLGSRTSIVFPNSSYTSNTFEWVASITIIPLSSLRVLLNISCCCLITFVSYIADTLRAFSSSSHITNTMHVYLGS